MSFEFVKCASALVLINGTPENDVCGSTIPAILGQDWIKWILKVHLFFYCNFIVKSVLSSYKIGNEKQLLQSLVLCCLTAFGGSFLNPALLGVPAPPLDNPVFFQTMILVWLLHQNRFYGHIWRKCFNFSPVLYVTSASFEVFRLFVMFAWYIKAYQRLSPGGKVWGPIVCGTLGGSGGAFFPLSKGMTPLDEGVPWNVKSAFTAIALYHVLTFANLYGDSPVLTNEFDTSVLRLSFVVVFVLTRLRPNGILMKIIDSCYTVAKSAVGLRFSEPVLDEHSKKD